MSDCGGESCCASLEVPGGTFFRTYVNDGGGPTSEADPATVNAFRLDKYDVTVGRFRQFVGGWNCGAGWKPARGSGKPEARAPIAPGARLEHGRVERRLTDGRAGGYQQPEGDRERKER